jgi:hypothetical protein
MKAVLCICLIAVVAFFAVGEAKNPSDSEEQESVEQPIDDIKIVKSMLPELIIFCKIFKFNSSIKLNRIHKRECLYNCQ